MALLMYAGAPLIADMIGNRHVVPSIRAASWALLFVPVMTGLRGYFQGLQQMVPTAVSQVVEQTIRVTVMIVLLLWLIETGRFSLETIAAGAIDGLRCRRNVGGCLPCWGISPSSAEMQGECEPNSWIRNGAVTAEKCGSDRHERQENTPVTPLKKTVSARLTRLWQKDHDPMGSGSRRYSCMPFPSVSGRWLYR